MLNVSRRSSSSELYKVTPTRGIERIYKFIDPNRDTLLSSFQNYDLKQINDYIEINRQTEEEKAARLKVWNVLRRVTEPCVTDGYLALGGSTLSKLATKGADLDLCFAVRCTEGEYEEEGVNHHILERICAGLEDLVGKAIDGVQIRRIEKVNARVPILKLNLRIPYDLIPVDINANCVAGIYNSHLLFYYARLDERFVHMNMILKEWGKVNDVIQPRFGKLNSYTVSLMIIHFLQCGVNPPILPNLYALFPQHFEGKVDINKLDYNLHLELPKIPKNDRTVGELIYGFFEYYCRFNYDDWGISIKEGRIFDRRNQPEEERQYLFFLEEAYDGMTVPKNLTRRYKLADILTKFKDGRPLILRDICKPFSPPAIDTAWDFVCQLEDENGRNVHQNNNLDGRI